jgi:hypothetical protein
MAVATPLVSFAADDYPLCGTSFATTMAEAQTKPPIKKLRGRIQFALGWYAIRYRNVEAREGRNQQWIELWGRAFVWNLRNPYAAIFEKTAPPTEKVDWFEF